MKNSKNVDKYERTYDDDLNELFMQEKKELLYGISKTKSNSESSNISENTSENNSDNESIDSFNKVFERLKKNK